MFLEESVRFSSQLKPALKCSPWSLCFWICPSGFPCSSRLLFRAEAEHSINSKMSDLSRCIQGILKRNSLSFSHREHVLLGTQWRWVWWGHCPACCQHARSFTHRCLCTTSTNVSTVRKVNHALVLLWQQFQCNRPLERSGDPQQLAGYPLRTSALEGWSPATGLWRSHGKRRLQMTSQQTKYKRSGEGVRRE